MKTTQKQDAATFRNLAGKRKIREIIVHCSATPEGREVRATDIRLWHTRDRGFSDIGYHFVVSIDGTVETGRPLHRSGAHCLGHNRHSVGICYVGGLNRHFKSADTRTAKQRATLEQLIATLKQAFPEAIVYGHRDFARKDCPCFNAHAEYN